MYKIEKLLIDRGYVKENFPKDFKSIVYEDEEETGTQVQLIPKRQKWEILCSFPYMIAVNEKEPTTTFADEQAQLLKDHIENYIYQLRKDLLSLPDPWSVIEDD